MFIATDVGRFAELAEFEASRRRRDKAASRGKLRLLPKVQALASQGTDLTIAAKTRAGNVTTYQTSNLTQQVSQLPAKDQAFMLKALKAPAHALKHLGILTDSWGSEAANVPQSDEPAQSRAKSADADTAQPSSALPSQLMQPETGTDLPPGFASSSTQQLHQHATVNAADDSIIQSSQHQQAGKAKLPQRPIPELQQMQQACAQGPGRVERDYSSQQLISFLKHRLGYQQSLQSNTSKKLLVDLIMSEHRKGTVLLRICTQIHLHYIEHILT